MCSPKRQQQMTSAQRVAENEDVLIEILKRLPLQSLVISRRVCKHWRTLISSSEFCYAWNLTPRELKPTGFLFYDKTRPSRSKFLYLDDNMPATTVSPYPVFLFFCLKVVHSCNGLILGHYFHFRSKTSSCYVRNPATKQQSVELSVPGGKAYEGALALAFDPNVSLHYKVLCPRFPERVVYVYSSEFRDWKVVEVTISVDQFDQKRIKYPVYFDGFMYWLAESRLDYGLRFDVEKERVERLRLPITSQEQNQGIGSSEFCYMGVCGDRLYVVEKYSVESLYYIVHEMGKDGSGWVVKYRINCGKKDAPSLRVVKGQVFYFVHAPDVLCLFRGENGELGMVFSSRNIIVAYSVDSMIGKMLVGFGNSRDLKAFEHIETLYFV